MSQEEEAMEDFRDTFPLVLGIVGFGEGPELVLGHAAGYVQGGVAMDEVEDTKHAFKDTPTRFGECWTLRRHGICLLLCYTLGRLCPRWEKPRKG